MLHQNEKLAAYRIKSVDDLANIVGKATNDKAKAEEITKDLYSKGGSGSIVFDGIKGLLKKTPIKPVKKLGHKIEEVEDKAHKKLYDLDIKAAKKIDDKLQGKKYAENLFNRDEIVKVKENPDGKADEYIHVKVPSLMATPQKAIKASMPMIGGFWLGGKLLSGPKEKESEQQKEAVLKELEMVKKANDENLQLLSSANDDINNYRAMFAKYASAMENASHIIQTLVAEKDEALAKLASIELNSFLEEKKERAEKIASLELEKGLVSSNDFDAEVQKLAAVADETLEMLENTISKIPQRESVIIDNGLSNILFADNAINLEPNTEDLSEGLEKFVENN